MFRGVGETASVAELVEYQRSGGGQLPMYPHGHPDPVTLINQGAYSPDEMWTNDQFNYIHHGMKPSSFVRDLQGVSNQIPQWAWLVTGTLLLGLGVYTYVQASKKRK